MDGWLPEVSPSTPLTRAAIGLLLGIAAGAVLTPLIPRQPPSVALSPDETTPLP